MAIVVLDHGKTNLKLLAVDDGRVVWQRATPTPAGPGPPYRHIDLAAAESWLLATLRELAAERRVTTLVVCGHGSGAVLVDPQAPVLPMIDYEDTAPDWLDAAYAEVMPPYLERGSALMGGMAHLGRQLFFQQQAFPEEVRRAVALLALPQYWAWRLSGVMASEVTSLAAQSHLWNVAAGRPSGMVDRLGWAALLPALRPAWAELGPLRPGLAAATGLPPEAVVLNGIHDSSANLYRYQRAGLADAALLSTGTWLVGLRPGLPPARLDPRHAMTLNADVEGLPVGGVLAMIGREIELIAGGERDAVDAAEVERIVGEGAFAVPSFVALDGVLPGSAGKGRVIGRPGRALALLYAALMADLCLDLLQAGRTSIIDGGFAAEPMLAALVAALRPDLEILVEPAGGGTSLGAALLASHGRPAPPPALARATPCAIPGLAAYRERWRGMLPGPDGRTQETT